MMSEIFQKLHTPLTPQLNIIGNQVLI